MKAKKLLAILLSVLMLFSSIATVASAANVITIKVRVYDQSTGATYDIGTDTCNKKASGIQSEDYTIPSLTKWVSANSYKTVSKVTGNWYFPTSDGYVGRTVQWSNNSSTGTMTYWVDSYKNTTGGESGNGSTGTGSTGTDTGVTIGSGDKSVINCTLKYHSNYPSGVDYVKTVKYTIRAGYNMASYTLFDSNLKTLTELGFSTPSEYKFNHWQSAAGSTTFTATNGATIDVYADWKYTGVVANPVTVTYKDGDTTISTVSCLAGDVIVVPDYTKDETSILGWSATNSSVVDYKAGDMFTANVNTTLYTVWKDEAEGDCVLKVWASETGSDAGSPTYEKPFTAKITSGTSYKWLSPEEYGIIISEGYEFAYYYDNAERSVGSQSYVFANAQGWSAVAYFKQKTVAKEISVEFVDAENTVIQTAAVAVSGLYFDDVVINGADLFTTEGYAITGDSTFTGKAGQTDKVTFTVEAVAAPHEHAYTSAVTKEPTCTETGTMTYTCDCGDSYTEEIKAKGHVEFDMSVEASLQNTGCIHIVCSECGKTLKFEIIPKLEEATVVDEESGISISYDAAAFDSDVTLDVAVGNRHDNDNIYFNGTDYTSTKIWDITILDSEGNKVQPKVPVSVMIPLPDGFNADKIAVWHYDLETGETEKIENVTVKYVDEAAYVCFTASSFSPYIVVDESSAVETPDEPAESCKCGCHEDGFRGLIWKIINLIHIIFNKTEYKTCACGKAHW